MTYTLVDFVVNVRARALITVALSICLSMFNGVANAAGGVAGGEDAALAHERLLSADAFPSAARCGECHRRIYDEWRASSHAYAGVSPMFHKFEQKITEIAPTIGTFCVRCHMGVATTLGEPRELPLWQRGQVSREGVTCVSCHRVSTPYGKVNGERRIDPGSIQEPVRGPFGGDGVATVIRNAARYAVAVAPGARGTKMHSGGVKFEQLSKSEFCVSCHQVAVNLGIKLEVVWDQYQASPAKKSGVTCQDCHMGKVPGIAAGYESGPAADGMRNGTALNPERKRSNHTFFGPGYSIAHPGIFPHNNAEAAEQWSAERWLSFNYRAKWGSEQFERDVDSRKIAAPASKDWSDQEDRKQAWSIVEENLNLIRKKKDLRRQVMENGIRIDGPFFDSTPRLRQPLRFSIKVTNINPGHNLPSGSLGAQPELWLNVALINPSGARIWESGYLDSIGDMADLHSADVRTGKLSLDSQLFNLQTKFLTTNVKGTEREMYLPVNLDVDQLPFLRPPGIPTTVLNHPPFVRMEQKSIPPLGSRVARYVVPPDLMRNSGTYKLSVRMRSRAEPIYFMRFVGATIDMERAMNEGILDIHPYSAEFKVAP